MEAELLEVAKNINEWFGWIATWLFLLWACFAFGTWYKDDETVAGEIRQLRETLEKKLDTWEKHHAKKITNRDTP